MIGDMATILATAFWSLEVSLVSCGDKLFSGQVSLLLMPAAELYWAAHCANNLAQGCFACGVCGTRLALAIEEGRPSIIRAGSDMSSFGRHSLRGECDLIEKSNCDAGILATVMQGISKSIFVAVENKVFFGLSISRLHRPSHCHNSPSTCLVT